MLDFAAKFGTAPEYETFLETYATPEQRHRWSVAFGTFTLAEAHRSLLDTFVRDMNVLCLAAAWCGDCVNQCPVFEHFARACPKIHLRFVDRDADAELTAAVRICGGNRIPVVVFLSEDFNECARYGDRTLSDYREMASKQLGAAYPTGSAASRSDRFAAAEDWLGEFERIQLMLRLSPRLRQEHRD